MTSTMAITINIITQMMVTTMTIGTMSKLELEEDEPVMVFSTSGITEIKQ